MISDESDVLDRRVVGEVPLGSRVLRVCVTGIRPTGETVAEVVEYNPRAEPGRDPYGAGAIIPLPLLSAVIGRLSEINDEYEGGAYMDPEAAAWL